MKARVIPQELIVYFEFMNSHEVIHPDNSIS